MGRYGETDIDHEMVDDGETDLDHHHCEMVSCEMMMVDHEMVVNIYNHQNKDKSKMVNVRENHSTIFSLTILLMMVDCETDMMVSYETEMMVDIER